MKDFLPTARVAGKRDAAHQRAGGAFKASESRDQMIKNELAAASAANDAKTARLRALRLEKERQDAEAVASAAPTPAKAKKKTVRRITD
ncbi:MAG: hypothetical protein BGN85_08135 [Alphaproteobacteria bacterium 64-11]|nr:hypothetical protein [Alphaproteobacteria bacterium]OJU07821.1 MAG: hypothetical protein BGN85_08135 [Alphaproteobacteria bacterium 64-11]